MKNESFIRLLNYRETEEKKVITVGMVSERTDSYETVIEPDGCLSPLASVPVDYNHNRISTGAKIKDKGVQEITVQINGIDTEVTSRIVDIEVYKDSRMWDRTNKDSKAEDVPSLYENVENGRIGWVSVDFSPVESAIEKVLDAKDNIIRVIYKQWRLNFLSLLDTKPGQDDSYFLDVRSLNKNKINLSTNTMSKKDIKRAYLSDIVKNSAGDIAKITTVTKEDDEAGKETKSYVLTKLDGTEVTTDSVGYGYEDSDDGDDYEWNTVYASDIIWDVLVSKSAEITRSNEEEPTEPEEPKEVKKEDTPKEPETPEEPEELKKTPTEEEPTTEEEPKEDSEEEAPEEEVKRMKKELKEKDSLIRQHETKIEKITDTNTRLNNSPDDPEDKGNDSATDMESGEDAKPEVSEEESNDRVAKKLSAGRWS